LEPCRILATHAFLSYLFYSYAPPLDLHSFPTRRSSDLSGRDIQASSVTKSRVRAATYHSTSPNSASSGPRSPAAASSASFPAASDRKSTRLNSSHVKISYAVFCLKKKT